MTIVPKQTLSQINPLVVDVDALVRDNPDLVSLPEIFLKIRQLMDDINSELDDFARVVNIDPALAATVLKVVNSAYYGMTGQVTTVSRALNLIGIGQLHDLVLMVSAVGTLKLSNEIETLTVFWQRSIYCGVLSKLLAEHSNVKDADDLFIIGLLHEIGRLLLFINYPEESKQAIMIASATNQPLSDVERTMFATDFGAIGQVLMTEWKLPEKIQSITGNQLQPSNATDYIIETNIVHIAHKIAANHYFETDSFVHPIDNEILATIGISEEELGGLCSQANEITQDMEKLILGNRT